MATCTKKILKMVTEKAIDVIFESYADEKLENSTLEQMLSKFERYKLITLFGVFTEQLRPTPQDITKCCLATLLNPAYQYLLNLGTKILLNWRQTIRTTPTPDHRI